MTKEFRRKVELAAQKAGWMQNTGHSKATYPYERNDCEWYWDVWQCTGLNAMSRKEIYELAAFLLGVKK